MFTTKGKEALARFGAPVLPEAERIRQATKDWISGWNNIPSSLIEKAYGGEAGEGFKLLAGGERVCCSCGGEVQARQETDDGPTWFCEGCDDVREEDDVEWSRDGQDGWPAMWGTLFNPAESYDERWIRDNADLVADLGFLVYECDEGIFLGVDGAGFDFYDALWIPLYRARGLRWHEHGVSP